MDKLNCIYCKKPVTTIAPPDGRVWHAECRKQATAGPAPVAKAVTAAPANKAVRPKADKKVGDA